MNTPAVSPAPIQWLVVPWGTANTAEIFNALMSANVAQDRFHFEPHHETIALKPDLWHLPAGGLDLDKACKKLMGKEYFKQLVTMSNLIFITAEPYSVPGAVGCIVDGKFIPGYCYENDVLGDGKVSLISTYIWENLPLRLDLPALAPSGRRALAPFILLILATIALDKLIDTEAHNETLACPNDYCQEAQDIDAFFARGKWYCEEFCNPVLRNALSQGKLHADQLKAVKRILNRARGIPANEGYDSCFISYGRPDKEFAHRLYRDLKAQGIECWIYDEDSLPGDETWAGIDSERRFADRILMVCSVESLGRAGVKKELETQVDEDPNKLIPVSRDADWLDEGFTVDRGLGNLMPFLRNRNYADFTTRPYVVALNRLVKALHWK